MTWVFWLGKMVCCSVGGVPPFTESLCFFSAFLMAFLCIAYAHSRKLAREREGPAILPRVRMSSACPLSRFIFHGVHEFKKKS